MKLKETRDFLSVNWGPSNHPASISTQFPHPTLHKRNLQPLLLRYSHTIADSRPHGFLISFFPRKSFTFSHFRMIEWTAKTFIGFAMGGLCTVSLTVCFFTWIAVFNLAIIQKFVLFRKVFKMGSESLQSTLFPWPISARISSGFVCISSFWYRRLFLT